MYLFKSSDTWAEPSQDILRGAMILNRIFSRGVSTSDVYSHKSIACSALEFWFTFISGISFITGRCSAEALPSQKIEEELPKIKKTNNERKILLKFFIAHPFL